MEPGQELRVNFIEEEKNFLLIAIVPYPVLASNITPLYINFNVISKLYSNLNSYNFIMANKISIDLSYKLIQIPHMLISALLAYNDA